MTVPDIGMEQIMAFLEAHHRPVVDVDGKPEICIQEPGFVWMALHSPRNDYHALRNWALNVLVAVLKTGIYTPTEQPPRPALELSKTFAQLDAMRKERGLS